MSEKADDQAPDFESALKELEALVETLESGELDLNQSLAHFKRGVELSRQCRRMLDTAQQSVEALVDPQDESGAAPFTSGTDSDSPESAETSD